MSAINKFVKAGTLPTWKWRFHRDSRGKEQLVPPRCQTPIGYGGEERLAVPIPSKGPFTMSDNGYRVFQIMDGDDRMVATVDYNAKEDITDPEEALWLAQVIVDGLNARACQPVPLQPDVVDLVAARAKDVIEWARSEQIPSVTVAAIQHHFSLSYEQAAEVFSKLAKQFPVSGWSLLFAKSQGHYAHGNLFYGEP